MKKKRILAKRQLDEKRTGLSMPKSSNPSVSVGNNVNKRPAGLKKAKKQENRRQSKTGKKSEKVSTRKPGKTRHIVKREGTISTKRKAKAHSYREKSHPSSKISSVKKKGRSSTQKNRFRPVIRDVLLAAAVAVLLISTIVSVSFRFPKMDGYAMMTTLNDRDRLIVNKWKDAKRFSLIYFQEPGKKTYAIRRVIGLPGEEIAYKNDDLYVNHKLTPERFLEEARVDAKKGGYLLMADLTIKQLTGDSRIPEDSYFVLGDNRQFATDSRSYGLVKKDQIVGVVELRLLPFHTARYF